MPDPKGVAIVATLADAFSWDSQVIQYPDTGPAGLSYFKGVISPEEYVDCLLFRDLGGHVIGILNHYNRDSTSRYNNGEPLERKGNINIWVHPKHKRTGIGTLLVDEALLRYDDIDFAKQRYTIEGAKFFGAYLLEKGSF